MPRRKRPEPKTVNLSSLTLPITLFGSLVVAAAGAGGSYLAATEKLGQLEQSVTVHTGHIRELEKTEAGHQADMKGIEVQLAVVSRSLDRIENRLAVPVIPVVAPAVAPKR